MSKVKRHTIHRKNIRQLILKIRDSLSLLSIYINQQDQQYSRKMDKEYEHSSGK